MKIQELLSDKVRIKARSWSDLWDIINTLRTLASEINSQQKDLKTNENQGEASDTNSGYFKSESHRIIYALVELGEGYRVKELKVDMSHYKDTAKARQWRNNIAKLIHPDHCDHPKAGLAIQELNKMFIGMIGE
jgi:hypothetical protein